MKVLPALCLLACLCACEAFPYDFAGLKPEGYVSDYARVLDPGSREQLELYCAGLERAAGVQFAVVTLPTLQGEPLEDVANDLYRKWGIGQKGKNEGLLVLVVIQDRRFRVEVGYGLEPIVTDGYAGSVLRSVGPEMQQGRYGEALLDAVHQLGSRVAEGKRVSLDGQRPRRPRRRGSPIPIGLLLGGLGVFGLLSALAGRRRGFGYNAGGVIPALIIGSLLGRSFDSSRGGGGFGGFDSSDGFGGFGGGDSGGGGASGSW